MVDLSRKIAAEKENVERALDNLKDVMGRKEKSVIELAAIATFLHGIYNGIENILKHILKAEGTELLKSETWHKDLLNTSVSIGIIPEKLSDEIYEYLTFRHFFVHGYGFMLEEAHLENLARNIPSVWSQLLSAIEIYCRTPDNAASVVLHHSTCFASSPIIKTFFKMPGSVFSGGKLLAGFFYIRNGRQYTTLGRR